jgi:hypothetical protein
MNLSGPNSSRRDKRSRIENDFTPNSGYPELVEELSWFFGAGAKPRRKGQCFDKLGKVGVARIRIFGLKEAVEVRV